MLAHREERLAEDHRIVDDAVEHVFEIALHNGERVLHEQHGIAAQRRICGGRGLLSGLSGNRTVSRRVPGDAAQSDANETSRGCNPQRHEGKMKVVIIAPAFSGKGQGEAREDWLAGVIGIRGEHAQLAVGEDRFQLAAKDAAPRTEQAFGGTVHIENPVAAVHEQAGIGEPLHDLFHKKLRSLFRRSATGFHRAHTRLLHRFPERCHFEIERVLSFLY